MEVQDFFLLDKIKANQMIENIFFENFILFEKIVEFSRGYNLMDSNSIKMKSFFEKCFRKNRNKICDLDTFVLSKLRDSNYSFFTKSIAEEVVKSHVFPFELKFEFLEKYPSKFFDNTFYSFLEKISQKDKEFLINKTEESNEYTQYLVLRTVSNSVVNKDVEKVLNNWMTKNTDKKKVMIVFNKIHKDNFKFFEIETMKNILIFLRDYQHELKTMYEKSGIERETSKIVHIKKVQKELRKIFYEVNKERKNAKSELFNLMELI